ncbi:MULTISPECIES: tetratricopeptide repeat protein [Enterococcus]|uniref:Tetratricopeptide repeat protein n=1 Tax=Candidatus Enterococcus mangumiae TaxID=2230878 RepID=A0ABZ2SWK4_9ENTE|nr:MULTISPECIES: tetratricopeptide repeat protein [unclassified Enterococcus]MBO0460269.1 tetratricopeptide repeat protein [Enterococcus sp. DIV1298c]MBO0490265.1 tetratricopeptide repeat protein [Enterococcus sp. DIV1094]MBO1300422.1 tetratricopeptide repeat protein [Enterococcus sp. DIV1271a]
MFGFLKKKKEQPVEIEELSIEEKEALLAAIEQLKKEIDQTEEIDRLAKLFEEVGLKSAELGDKDQAIEQLEKSLSLKKSINDGYKKLMSLYNEKRAEAARAGDDQGIDRYMSKMDDMRQIAKKLTITGNK